MKSIAILGAGSFGTSLAIALGRDRDITLWARDPSVAEHIADRRVNPRHLSDCTFPESVRATSEMSEIKSEILLLTVPTQSLSGFLSTWKSTLGGRTLVLCCKGVDLASGKSPSTMVSEHVPDATIAILTGPSFATDIALGMPTALTLATPMGGAELQATLSCSTLRLYLTDDVVGAELCGALKNVIALAAGMTFGAGFGESARAAVITRGFVEISRFATHFGARSETLVGLSGLGDLILTATSEKSRNYRAGLAFGAGGTARTGETVEGIPTAQSIASKAHKMGLDMPLTATVAAVTEGRVSITEAMTALMSRPLKKE